MLKRIDESQFLSNILQKFSNGLARQRGLPIVVGIALIIVSFVLQSIDVFTDSNLLELLGVVTHHLGVLIALIGLLLSAPLGK